MSEKTTAAQNFLISLDLTLPMVVHFKNCMKDARDYKWPSSIVIEIMEGIEEKYKKKENTNGLV